jgi:tetratricopeptide (TPR) repeat protein
MKRDFLTAALVLCMLAQAEAQHNDLAPPDRTDYPARDAYSVGSDPAQSRRGIVSGPRWAPAARPEAPPHRYGNAPQPVAATGGGREAAASGNAQSPSPAVEPASPPDSATLVARGADFHGQGQYDKAIEQYTQALKREPRHTEALNRRAEAFMATGEYDRAIADCSYALRFEKQPDRRARSLLVRGRAYFNRSEYNLAVADYTEALKLKPDYGEAFFYRGLAHYYKGEFDQALSAFSAALGYAEVSEAFLYRGLIHDLKENPDSGTRDYDAALRAAGAEEPEAASSGAEGAFIKEMVAGRRLEREGKTDEAAAAYTRALARSPGSAPAYQYRAGVSLKKGEYQKAIADYDAALGVRPAYVSALTGRGDACYAAGDYDRAIADYTEAARYNPGLSRTFNSRGNAYFKKGEYDRAIADYETALALDPSFLEAAGNLRKAYDTQAGEGY